MPFNFSFTEYSSIWPIRVFHTKFVYTQLNTWSALLRIDLILHLILMYDFSVHTRPFSIANHSGTKIEVV
jgi:hypothetical protein